MVRIRWRRVHRWVGLLIAVSIAAQGVTGAILAVAELIPAQRTSSAPPRPVNEIVAAAEHQVTAGSHATRYFAPDAAGYAARVEVAVRGQTALMIRIDPATLAVIDASASGSSPLELVRSLHEKFLTVADGGRALTGWFGVGLLIMLATAVPIWWPRDGGIKQALLPDLSARDVVFYHRLHGAAGGWTILVLALLTLTGIAMAFPVTARGVLGLPTRGASKTPPAGSIPSAVDLDRAVDLARQAVPGAIPRMLVLPQADGAAVRVMMGSAGGGAVGAIQVQVDAAAGRIVSIDAPATRPFGETLYRWLHDLHTGDGIGGWWRVVAAAAGLSLPLLAFTGPMMWWRKRRGVRRKARGRHQAADRAALTTD
jgi:uncharacterized iron-regulated membrane protein